MILKQRQTQMAFQIAMGRERFKYYQMFYFTLTPLMLIGAIVKKNPQFLAPIIPLSYAFAYQYDMLYKDMFERARIQADKLILEYPKMFYLPEHSGIVSLQDYEKILGLKNGKKVL